MTEFFFRIKDFDKFKIIFKASTIPNKNFFLASLLYLINDKKNRLTFEKFENP